MFFPPADAAQNEIWDYTCDLWGQEQAEKYITGLHEHLKLLSEKKKLWWSLPAGRVVPSDLNIQAYFSRYEHHYIFFRELSGNRVGVMSILHEKSDIPVRLRGDLNKIQEMKG